VAIKAMEDLGNCKIVTVQLAENTLKVKLSEEQEIPAESGFLEFQPQWVRIYADEKLVGNSVK
ncbi:MAG: hypothetical protein OES29_14440, partial [Desulfuromonadales bacterium]|nr:hypothetical protein [Desulfuromonadales bacterium]